MTIDSSNPFGKNTFGIILPTINWDFVEDDKLRSVLQRDYAELVKLVRVSANKSILLFCGSILEATIITILQNEEEAAKDAYRKLYPKSEKILPLADWKLYQLIAVSEKVGILDSDTRIQSDILRDYRNLIHPMAEIRRNSEPDKETVTSVLSLFIRTIRILSEKNPSEKEDVYHPASTEIERGKLNKCVFSINPRFTKKTLWETLADVLVEVNINSSQREGYLIPSGYAPIALRHTENLKTNPELLERKRTLTLQFIEEWKHREIAGKYFFIQTHKGERLKVYSLIYDSFLRSNIEKQ